MHSATLTQDFSMATLKDVSLEAGVGVSTASIVLSHGAQATQIPKATQERVFAAAQKLKYRPRAGGRQIRKQRSKNIALFMSSEQDHSSLAEELLFAINDELLRHDYALTFVRLNDASLNDPDFTPRFLRQVEVDGVLVNYNIAMPQRFVDLINHYDMPAVYLNIKRDTDTVYFNHYEASRQAVGRLIGLGHRQIAFANFTCDYNHHSFLDTRQGYIDEIAAANLVPLLIEEKTPRGNRIAAARRLLQTGSGQCPSAILTMSLSSAIPFVQAADRLGWETPRDLSLITMDGSRALASLVQPEFSRIVLPWAKAGKNAVQMLLEKLEDKAPPMPSQVLDCGWHDGGPSIDSPRTIP
jgi:LacI family transcriptional regulator